jgi:transposase
LLRPVEVEKLVPADHLVRAIGELTGRLDLTASTAEVKAVEGVAGRPPVHPRLLISLWIYAYSQSIAWAREVERGCEYDPAFQGLTGMEVVNQHSLSDFRGEHAQALDELLAQVLAVRSSEGLIGLEGVVVHDGRKVQAAASSQSFHREETLRAPVAEFSNLWLKAKLGLGQFCVRGLQKVRCEVLGACLTYNIQQWFRLRWKVRLQAAQAGGRKKGQGAKRPTRIEVIECRGHKQSPPR